MTQPMAVDSRLLAGDPARLAGTRGNLAVEAHCKLCADEGTPGQSVLDVELVETHRALFIHPDQCLDAGGREPGDPSTAHAFIRIGHADHDARDARQDDCLGTRRRSVTVSAWLEVHIEGATARGVTRHGE